MLPLPSPSGCVSEFVWDFRRPPRLERFSGPIVVVFAGKTVAGTRRALRMSLQGGGWHARPVNLMRGDWCGTDGRRERRCR